MSETSAEDFIYRLKSQVPPNQMPPPIIRDSQTGEILSEILTLMWEIAEKTYHTNQCYASKSWFRGVSNKIQELHKKL